MNRKLIIAMTVMAFMIICLSYMAGSCSRSPGIIVPRHRTTRLKNKNRRKLPSPEKTTQEGTGRKKKEEKEELTPEGFFEALVDMGETIVALDLPYNGNASAASLEEADEFNCALYVSWTLQEMGLLPEGKTFWFNDKGHGSGYDHIKKDREHFRIYHPDCPIAEASMLEPGDICGMKINGYAAHTAVFAGRDPEGNMVWYSAGRTDFGKMAKKDFTPIRFKYYEQEDDMLYTIVRIRYDRK